MKRFSIVLSLMVCASANAQSNQASSPGIEALPRDVEMELASSALPAHLRTAATIYVLDPRKGFEVARKGTNGFHALVARTGDDAFRGSWPLTEYPPDVLYPIAFDAAGATRAHASLLRRRCKHKPKVCPPAELKQLIQERFKTRALQASCSGRTLVHAGADHADLRRSRDKVPRSARPAIRTSCISLRTCPAKTSAAASWAACILTSSCQGLTDSSSRRSTPRRRPRSTSDMLD